MVAILLQLIVRPGDQVFLTVNMIDELNQLASGFLQFDTVNGNNQVVPF